ncbi:MAG: hypothetical protein R3321_04580 [Nitrososphaeraceae archaeon]|nr:hypothetical protein [Nitrososphaeraceae archaeon]
MYLKEQSFTGKDLQTKGPIKKDYDVVQFSQFIEKLFFGHRLELILPHEKWKLDATRAYTNEQFTLADLRYVTYNEDKYFRNLSSPEQNRILNTMFKIITIPDDT